MGSIPPVRSLRSLLPLMALTKPIWTMPHTVPKKMRGAVLPGDSTVKLVPDIDVPSPGHGEVLIKTKASTICGSDIRCDMHLRYGSWGASPLTPYLR